MSADPRNAAVFHNFSVIPEISVNLGRTLKGYVGGGGTSTTTWPSEMVQLSKSSLQNFTKKFVRIFFKNRSFCTRLSSIFCLKELGPEGSRSILAMTNVHDHWATAWSDPEKSRTHVTTLNLKLDDQLGDRMRMV